MFGSVGLSDYIIVIMLLIVTVAALSYLHLSPEVVQNDYSAFNTLGIQLTGNVT